MKEHLGKRLFISGIPTAGKSYLAKKLAAEVGGKAIYFDRFRDKLFAQPEYKKWVNFYWDQNEEEYLKKAPSQIWSDLVRQSEGLWPAFLKKIEEHATEAAPVIFECVNMLPHLARRDLNFPGLIMIGSSYEQVLERNKEKPRWSNDPHLQELEAKSFFFVERPLYKSEGEKYDYPVFEDSNAAFEWAVKKLK